MSAARGERDDLVTQEVLDEGGAGLLIRISGELGVSNVDELEADVDRALSKGATKLVIDARGLGAKLGLQP